MKEILGKQTMLELYGCKKTLLNNKAFIEDTMLQAAKAAKATIIEHYFHQFSPYGISGTVVIAESHINIHTWPEYDFAAIDIFTCSQQMDDEKACTFLKEAFEAAESISQTYKRGSMAHIKKVRDSQILHHHQ